MRKSSNSLFTLIIFIFILTACGKESGSNGLLALLGMGGGGNSFMKQFGIADSGSNSYPFDNLTDSKTQYLYTPADIGGSGMITMIRLLRSNDWESGTCRNMSIKMGHTNLTALTTTWANNVETGQGPEVTVLGNRTVEIPRGAAGTWIEIPLDTPFNYNGVDSLVVDIERTTACSAAVYATYNATANRRVYDSNTDTAAGTAEYNATTASAVDDRLPWMQFVFTGGDNKIRHTGTSNIYPFDPNPSYQRVEMLYTAGEINGTGIITGIGFTIATASTGQTYTITVRMGHTRQGALVADSWDANFNSGAPVTVADTAVLSIPNGAPAGSNVWLPLTGSFHYNGTDNLVVDLQVTAASGTTFLVMSNDGTGSRLLGSIAAVSGPADNTRYSTMVRFKGGTADIITAGDYSYSQPFSGVSGSQVQTLYRPSETGLNGTVESIGFRLKDDSVAETYNNFSIVIGHTAKNILGLGDAFASNMDDAVTVYSGAAVIPAGLKAGDWVNFTLSTPFAGNPAKNLAVYIKSDQGIASHLNNVGGESNATHYTSRSSNRMDTTTSTPGTVTNSIMSIRLGLK